MRKYGSYFGITGGIIWLGLGFIWATFILFGGRPDLISEGLEIASIVAIGPGAIAIGGGILFKRHPIAGIIFVFPACLLTNIYGWGSLLPLEGNTSNLKIAIAEISSGACLLIGAALGFANLFLDPVPHNVSLEQ